MNLVYSNAFAETLFIIKCLPHNVQIKIPNDFISFLNDNKNNDYVISINPNIGLQNQNLLTETKELLKEIYLSYFISSEERNRISQYDNYRNAVEEDLKNKKYNNDIFDNKSTNVSASDCLENTMVKSKEPSIFSRWLDKIKSLFK